jgi:peptidoglycan/LPS O-acetylase OafA/YrhL
MSILPFKTATAASKESGGADGATSMGGGRGARIPELDGARGVAILMVVGLHYITISQDSSNWFVKLSLAVVSFGWSGVDLFFVLSGLLIGGILIDNRNASNYFRTFYLRRVCRIFPLYFLWLTLYYVLPLVLPRGFPGYSDCFGWEISHFPKWGYIFYLQNFYAAATSSMGPLWMAATWSLAIEEQFYLVLPAVLWVALPRKPLPILIALIAFVPALRIFMYLFQSSMELFLLFPCRADALLIGVLCAYLLRQERAYAWLVRNKKALYALFLCLLLPIGYLVSLGYGHGIREVLDSFELGSFGFTVIALFCACFLVIALIDKGGLIARVLRSRILRHFGSIAYGMYIIHLAMRSIIGEFILGTGAKESPILFQNLVSVVAFLASWILAVLSWKFFEGPIVRWGHSFRYAAGKTAKGPVAAPCEASGLS